MRIKVVLCVIVLIKKHIPKGFHLPGCAWSLAEDYSTVLALPSTLFSLCL